MWWEYFKAKRAKVLMNPEDEENVEGKIIVITGANDGIGKVAALELAKRGATIIMACRDLEKAQSVKDHIKKMVLNAKLEIVELDLEDYSSVRTCAQNIKTLVPHINILINNAGLMYLDPFVRKTKEGHEIQMAVNHLGHFLLTMLLLDQIKLGAPSRIITVSSVNFQLAKLDLDDLMLEKSGVFGQNNTGGYSNSKLANMLFVKSLTKRIAGTGVNTYALCPGLVETNLSRNAPGWFFRLAFKFSYTIAGQTPDEGAETILYCTLSKKCSGETGEMYRFNTIWPNTMSNLDDDLAEQLWIKSEELVGLSKSK